MIPYFSCFICNILQAGGQLFDERGAPLLDETPETLSVYDVEPHPDFRYRLGGPVLRLAQQARPGGEGEGAAAADAELKEEADKSGGGASAAAADGGGGDGDEDSDSEEEEGAEKQEHAGGALYGEIIGMPDGLIDVRWSNGKVERCGESSYHPISTMSASYQPPTSLHRPPV